MNRFFLFQIEEDVQLKLNMDGNVEELIDIPIAISIEDILP